MPWMSSLSSRRGTRRRAERVLRELHAGPQPGPDVCARCFDLTDGGTRCYHCSHDGDWVDAMAPISYSIGGEQLHHALAGYKRHAGHEARYLTAGLAAVLWRHLREHERCLARAAGVAGFDVVTTVPSSDAGRDGTHPLHRLVGELVKPLVPRYERLLSRSCRCGRGRAQVQRRALCGGGGARRSGGAAHR